MGNTQRKFSEIFRNRDRQTDRHAHHNTLHPVRGKMINRWSLLNHSGDSAATTYHSGQRTITTSCDCTLNEAVCSRRRRERVTSRHWRTQWHQHTSRCCSCCSLCWRHAVRHRCLGWITAHIPQQYSQCNTPFLVTKDIPITTAMWQLLLMWGFWHRTQFNLPSVRETEKIIEGN